MAAHAVLKVADALIQVSGLNPRRIMLVATVAGVFLEVRRHVTGLARDVAAFAMVQRERMIERRALPRRRGVTRRTIGAKLAKMCLRFGMATHTRLRRALEDIVDVTLGALHRNVFAGQLEGCQIVIEFGVGPTGRIVARRAVRAKRAVVLVIFLMATHARLRCAFENVADVTLGALDINMFPF